MGSVVAEYSVEEQPASARVVIANAAQGGLRLHLG
jgi:hypothetical protein